MAHAAHKWLPDARRVELENVSDKHFGAVFALDSLEHNDDVAPLIARLEAALADEGVLIVSGLTENLLYRIGRRIAGFGGHYHHQTTRRQALVAIAILALTPLTFVVSASLFVDNALALFTVAAIVFAARIRETPSPAHIAGFAIASAGAIAVKLQGVIAFGCVCVALLLFGGWREFYRSSGRTKFICLVALLAGFWPYAYAWTATGNPVFPHFNGVFKSPLFPQENFTMPSTRVGSRSPIFSTSRFLRRNTSKAETAQPDLRFHFFCQRACF